MTNRTTLDIAPEQLYARAENHVQFRPLFQDFKKLRDRIQRSGQIRVPKPRVIHVLLERAVHSTTHSLGLPAVLRTANDQDVLLSGRLQPFKYLERVIAAPVVDEDELHAGIFEKALERVYWKPAALVVTRNNNRDSRSDHGTILTD